MKEIKKKKKIVISAVNLTEAGFLSVLKDCLKAFSKIYTSEHLEIIVLVHKTELVKDHKEMFQIIEFPFIKKSWAKRIYFEYIKSKTLSKNINPDLWIALQDVSPTVTCKQVVYCHNPAPFYKLKGYEIFVDFKFFLMCLFYKFLYKINIKKNEFVIIQQEWLRTKFEENYGVKTIVAQPHSDSLAPPNNDSVNQIKNSKFLFFYPAFPRVAKNFEVLLEAADLLSKTRDDFEVVLTTNGSESKQAKKLFAKFNTNKNVRFNGLQTREQVFGLYNKIDCLVFPSNHETWGLPITEFKPFNKPMLLADLPYAHETLGQFSKVKFFKYDSSIELAKIMGLVIDNKLVYDVVKDTIHHAPFFKNWDELVMFLSKKVC